LAAWLPPTLLSLPQPAAGVLPTPVSISVAPDASVLAALRLGGYAVLAFLVLQVAARPERARAVAWAVVLGVVAHAVLALALLRLGDDAGLWGIKTAYEGSATGGFVNRNAFASFLGLGFLLGLSLLLAPSDQAPSGPRVPLLARLRAGPVLAAGALVLIGLALLATQSRMGFAAAALGAVICVALSMDLRRGFLRGALPWTLAVLGLAGVALWVLGGATLERAVFLESAVEDRGLLYAQVREMIAARPWTGWGADAFEPSFMLHHRPPLTSDFDWEYAHSTYLANWAEFGLVAGSIPFVVFLVVAWRLVAALRAGQGDPALTVAGLSVLAMAAFHAVVDFSYEVPANAYLLVLVIALGLGRLGTPRPR
jgi:O-antigen ligase